MPRMPWSAVVCLVTVAGAAPPPTPTAPPVVERSVIVDGVPITYRISGHGEPLILLHGYAQTSRMWNAAQPELAQRFTVITPDLPGFGESGIPANGLDVKTAATRIHALARALHIPRARVVGHDIGLMVAYFYAAQFPDEVVKLVLMDAFLPGIGDWENAYHDPRMWHFFFFGPTPERLVKDRERIYLDHFWDDFAADPRHSVSEIDRQAYAASYSRPGRMGAGWSYFANFPLSAKQFAQAGARKLAMPVLVIAGEKGAGDMLARETRLVATNVESVILPGTGHWLIDENPRATLAALEHFL